jgi:ribosome-associated protein
MSALHDGAAEPLRIRDDVSIPRAELVWRATRASGPGGQHVNKSSTRIELLWNIRASTALSPEEIERVVTRLGRRVDSEGWLRVVASQSRSQLQNRRLAEQRLAKLLQSALHVPRKRRPTRPSAASREERLRGKKLRSEKKLNRRADYAD